MERCALNVNFIEFGTKYFCCDDNSINLLYLSWHLAVKMEKAGADNGR